MKKPNIKKPKTGIAKQLEKKVEDGKKKDKKKYDKVWLNKGQKFYG